MTTLSLRTLVRNAAAVFSGCYGAVTCRAEQAKCSRQTVYDHARQVGQRLQPVAPAGPPAVAPTPPPTPAAVLDGPTRRRLAVTAFAMGISTRQIEDLFHVVLGDDGPDHATIGRWVADEASPHFSPREWNRAALRVIGGIATTIYGTGPRQPDDHRV